MDWIFLAELSVNGALTGLLYSLFAIGLVLVYKSSSVPNLAQGALTMLGAYIVLAFSLSLGLPLWVAIPISIIIMFFVGLGIEKVALRRLAGRPIVMILMMTLGLDIFIRGTTMAFWGGTSRPMDLGVSYDPFFAGPLLLSRSVGRSFHRDCLLLPQPSRHSPACNFGRLHGLMVSRYFGGTRGRALLGACLCRCRDHRRHLGRDSER